MGGMKIDIKPNARPVKKRPYNLAHKYKEIVKKEIDNMLTVGIIYPIDQSKWEIPMVVQPKKHNPTKLLLENIHTYGKIFHWKSDHQETIKPV